MNRSRLIGGTICLGLAALLAVLAIVLPPGSVVFIVGDTNIAFAPAIILGIIGLLLLVTASNGAQREPALSRPAGVQDAEKAALNKRLESIGWGLFLIALGGFALVPDELVPKGLWSIAVGVIMLGLNVTRYVLKIKMSGFTTFLGIVSLLSGVLQLAGLHDLEGPVLLIILGAYVLIKPWFDERQLFGKAEES